MDDAVWGSDNADTLQNNLQLLTRLTASILKDATHQCQEQDLEKLKFIALRVLHGLQVRQYESIFVGSTVVVWSQRVVERVVCVR